MIQERQTAIDGTFVPVARHELSSIEVDGELLLMDEQCDLHLLNRTGAIIWAFCDGTATIDEIAAELAELFGEDLARLQADIQASVKAMAEVGLLDGGEG